VFYTAHKILIGCQIQDDEMGVTSGKYGWEEKCTKVVCSLTLMTELRGRRRHNSNLNIKVDHKEILGPDVD
jgi:hypothetical protein